MEPPLLVQNKLLNLSCQCQVGFAIILDPLHGWTWRLDLNNCKVSIIYFSSAYTVHKFSGFSEPLASKSKSITFIFVWLSLDLWCAISQVDSIWMPDIEILNLKDFSTLDVLSKLEGLWLNKDGELIYAVASRITWICPMTFDSFPLDVQVNDIFSYLNNIFMIFFARFVSSKSEVLIMTSQKWCFTTNL